MSSKLTTTDRKEYKKLLETKQENLITALNGELFRNKEDLIREALFSKNFQYDSKELAVKIASLKKEIDDIVSEFLPEEQAALDIKIAEASEEIDQRILELKRKYAEDLEHLQNEKKLVRVTIIGDHTCLVEKLGMEKTPDKMEEMRKLTADLEVVKSIENSVTVEINRKMTLVKKMRYRIQSAINDKMNELFEELINIETREAAKEIVARVPTIAQLILSCETPDGLASLVQRLSPSLALPAPPPPKEELKPATEIKVEAKVIEEEAQVTNSNQEEDEDDDLVDEETEEEVEVES